MYAERLVLNTDSAGHLMSLPVLPANKRIEAIFLVLDKVNKHSIDNQSETMALANHSASNIPEWLNSEEDAVWN